ncbi:MAG TPA: cadmium resistance transporter [Burkholderiaceae bacterium]|jgi:cadmium resistance protein CadD (predicted permease)|nr:cadmium resistance transporter [Burkholderiaceae bacterium]
MSALVTDLGIGIAVFIATDIDDLFLLAVFFADARLDRLSIVIGQYLGVGALVLFSAMAALLALTIPEGWIALLGLVPLLMGLAKLPSLHISSVDAEGGSDARRIKEPKHTAERRLGLPILAVASVTVANGGDNVAVYIPLFATSFDAIATYALAFAVMTGVWCAIGYLLVNNDVLGNAIRRYGHVILPVVLIALGIYILSGALILLR